MQMARGGQKWKPSCASLMMLLECRRHRRIARIAGNVEVRRKMRQSERMKMKLASVNNKQAWKWQVAILVQSPLRSAWCSSLKSVRSSTSIRRSAGKQFLMSRSNRLKYSYCLQARRGSATVEAALLYPLVILILAFMIRQSPSLYDDIVCTASATLKKFNATRVHCCRSWSLLRGGIEVRSISEGPKADMEGDDLS